MITKDQEKRAQRLMRESIDSALAEMREYVNRELLAGRTPDKRMIVSMSNGLSKLAEDYSIDLMSGEYGSMIKSAMKTAAKEVADIAGGISLSVSTRQIDAALTVAGMKVKGILEEGQAVIGEELLKSIVGGKSQSDLANSISERLKIRDSSGDIGSIQAWKAEQIARNELSTNYRIEKQTASKEAGFTLFIMTGPDDERTAGDVCSKYLGQTHTVKEWEEIGEKEGIDPNYPLLEWGFHVNCRHDFDPVAGQDSDTEQEQGDDTDNPKVDDGVVASNVEPEKLSRSDIKATKTVESLPRADNSALAINIEKVFDKKAVDPDDTNIFTKEILEKRETAYSQTQIAMLENKSLPENVTYETIDPRTFDFQITQDGVRTSKVTKMVEAVNNNKMDLEAADTIDPPSMLVINGKTYLWDGHHRMITGYLLNKPVTVRMYKF